MMRGFLVSCEGCLPSWGSIAAAASEEGNEVGLSDVAHGRGEKVHDQDRSIGKVDVSEVAVDNGHLCQKNAAGRKKQGP